jgi:hypothetical protein
MRSLVTVVAAVTALLAGCSHAPGAPSLVGTVPFRVDGLTFVDVTINGVKAALVLDTGAPGIALDPSVAATAGLRTGEGRADSIRMGDVLLRDVAVTVLSFGALNDGTSGQPPVLGVIGTSVLGRSVARFDFAAGQLTLFDPASFRYEGTGAILPIRFEQEKPLVTATIERDGAPPVEARLVIDAGTESAPITLTPVFARAARIGTDGTRFVEVMGGRGVHGTGMDRITRVPAVTVGALRLAQPLVTVSAAVGAALQHLDADGTIGMGVLSRTTMILDYSRSRVILEPSTSFAAPFTYANVSGLHFQRRGGALLVRHVIRGSPADSAGILVDDEIVAIDDEPPPSAPVLAPLRDAGTTHRLTLRRAGETRTVTILLRELI